MIAAEKRSGRGRMMGMFWYSIKLRDAVKELSDTKVNLKRALSKQDEDNIKKCLKEKEKATEALREVQKEDRRYRDEMLDDLAEARAQKWKMKKNKRQ